MLKHPVTVSRLPARPAHGQVKARASNMVRMGRAGPAGGPTPSDGGSASAALGPLIEEAGEVDRGRAALKARSSNMVRMGQAAGPVQFSKRAEATRNRTPCLHSDARGWSGTPSPPRCASGRQPLTHDHPHAGDCLCRSDFARPGPTWPDFAHRSHRTHRTNRAHCPDR
jgi:hypothetical protein